MNLDELPKGLTIVGGGYIGLEFASMYADFGSKVTVVQDGDVFYLEKMRILQRLSVMYWKQRM